MTGGRSVPEWIGKTPDSAVPPRVKLRVFDAHDGVCHISKRKIAAGEAWECDHVKALVNGGENRESNLAPALKSAHQVKTADDVREKSADRRKRMKHLGIKQKKRLVPGSKGTPWQRKVDGTTVLRKPKD